MGSAHFELEVDDADQLLDDAQITCTLRLCHPIMWLVVYLARLGL